MSATKECAGGCGAPAEERFLYCWACMPEEQRRWLEADQADRKARAEQQKEKKPK